MPRNQYRLATCPDCHRKHGTSASYPEDPRCPECRARRKREQDRARKRNQYHELVGNEKTSQSVLMRLRNTGGSTSTACDNCWFLPGCKRNIEKSWQMIAEYELMQDVTLPCFSTSPKHEDFLRYAERLEDYESVSNLGEIGV